MIRDSFVTTTRGLDRQAPPMRLFEKAKRFGIWNPSDIDLSRDAAQWPALSELEQTVLLHLTSLFQAGEEAVTLDLLPLILAIAREGRLEEEMYLTTFLWEEAKHVDFFSRFMREVAGVSGQLDHFMTGESYSAIFNVALPRALQALSADPSPAAQVRASVTYNMIVEGVLAETGYHAYFTALERNDLLPGVRHGIRLLKQDESRHIAYGVYLLSRLVSAEPRLWNVVEETMNDLLTPALGVIGDLFASYDVMPFGLVEDDFVDYALGQFQKRISRIERARDVTLAEVDALTASVIDSDDG